MLEALSESVGVGALEVPSVSVELDQIFRLLVGWWRDDVPYRPVIAPANW